MPQENTPTPSPANRRASRRAPLRGTVRVECRKGSLGLGPNLVRFPLDISETGVRLVVKGDLKAGQEVEVLLVGGGYGRPLKKIGTVIWSLPTENEDRVVGIRFEGCVPYAELQGMTKPARVLT
jgi:hypothetical protein